MNIIMLIHTLINNIIRHNNMINMANQFILLSMSMILIMLHLNNQFMVNLIKLYLPNLNNPCLGHLIKQCLPHLQINTEHLQVDKICTEHLQVDKICTVHLQVVWMLDMSIKINMVRCPVMEKTATFEEKVIKLILF